MVLTLLALFTIAVQSAWCRFVFHKEQLIFTDFTSIRLLGVIFILVFISTIKDKLAIDNINQYGKHAGALSLFVCL
jgi:hypothetical protein